MEEKIFALIEKMHKDMREGFVEVNQRIKGLDERIDGIEKQQALIYEEVARTRGDLTEVRADLRLVKIATVENSKDIEKLKLIK